MGEIGLEEGEMEEGEMEEEKEMDPNMTFEEDLHDVEKVLQSSSMIQRRFVHSLLVDILVLYIFIG